MSLQVKIIPCSTDNYSYMCIDNKNNAFVVDPSEFMPVDEFIKTNNFRMFQAKRTSDSKPTHFLFCVACVKLDLGTNWEMSAFSMA